MLNIALADGIILTKKPGTSTSFAAAIIFIVRITNIISEALH